MRILRYIFFILFFSKGFFSYAVTTYSVGTTVAANWYSTIALAYAACTGSPAGGYVIEIQSSYVTEAFPITLGNLTNLTSSIPLIIRPAATLTISGSASRLFILDGAHHVTFDGRVGSSGSSVWTIDNTSTTNYNYTFRFANDANNITVKYCTVKGCSNYGCIYFEGTTGTTGNDNNTIDNCTIKPTSGTSF